MMTLQSSGRTPEAGFERLEAAARAYRLDPTPLAGRVEVVVGEITSPRLGLQPDAYKALAGSIDAIYHGAAAVNFIYPYHALREINVQGTRELVRFAFAEKRKPVWTGE